MTDQNCDLMCDLWFSDYSDYFVIIWLWSDVWSVRGCLYPLGVVYGGGRVFRFKQILSSTYSIGGNECLLMQRLWEKQLIFFHFEGFPSKHKWNSYLCTSVGNVGVRKWNLSGRFFKVLFEIFSTYFLTQDECRDIRQVSKNSRKSRKKHEKKKPA